MKEIAIIDIETSGFQPQGGLIVEIGIVGLNLETGSITNEFDSIVKEDGFNEKHTKHPYGWVFQNSDLKYDDVLSANSLTSMLSEIQSVLDKYPLGATAYNKAFYFSFLKSRGLRTKELECIMLSATDIVNLPPNFGYSTPKWPKVEEAWEYFFPDVEYKEKHRALDDAQHEALIAHELYKMNEFQI